MPSALSITYIPDTNPPHLDVYVEMTPDIPGDPDWGFYKTFYSTNGTLWTEFTNGPTPLPPGNLAAGYTFTYVAPISLTNGGEYYFMVEVFYLATDPAPASDSYLVEPVTVNDGGGGVECIVEGMCVRTPSGDVPVENLRPGDSVITSNNREVSIIKRKIVVVSKTTKATAPYMIEKHAFGINNPPAELCLSPRHGIQIAENLWEIPREAACDNKKVRQMDLGKSVTYYHLSLPNYETDTLIVNGQNIEALNDGKLIESYVWSKERKGYVRSLKPAPEKKKATA
jgi:hypothetical protein